MDKVKSEKDIYEKVIIQKMIAEDLTLSEALFFDMMENEVDPEDVYLATDYLEQMFSYDMDKVRYFMLVVSGQVPDSVLVPLNKVDDKIK